MAARTRHDPRHRPDFAFHPVDERCHGVLVTDVQEHGDATDLMRNFTCGSVLDVCNHDAYSVGGEPPAQRASNAIGTTGHDGNLDPRCSQVAHSGVLS